jgi:ribonuclease BN (tRNA processing enzyme)
MNTSVSLMGVKGGPAIKPGSNMPTSILVQVGDKNILVDAGLGVSRGICDQGVALTDIDLIIITHLHSDHYLELGPYFHTAWVAGLKHEIPVIGPCGLDKYWDGFLASMQFDINLRIEDEGRCYLSNLLASKTISEGQIYESNGIKITAMRNLHPPIRESYALRIETADKIIVLSGDTAYMDEMIEFAKGADILVHEALLESGVDALCASLGTKDDRLKNHLMRSHTSAANAGLIAKDAGVKKLALNHFVPGADPTITDQDWVNDVRRNWTGPLILGKDGLKIEI